MFESLEKINSRPKPFEFHNPSDLWTDDHISAQMLSCHLNDNNDAASRNSTFIDRSVEWISSYFGVGKGFKIADFGCGPGLYTTRLAKREAEVTGIDFSKRSIEYGRDMAARLGLPIKYIHQNYLDFDSAERFQLILLIYCDYCALTPEQRIKILTRFHTLLDPGGAVLLDVHSINRFAKQEEKAIYEIELMNGFWAPGRYYGYWNTFKYEEEKVTLDKYSIIESGRTRIIYNWLQYFTPETLAKELEDCGFTIESFYTDVAGAPFAPENDDFAIVARKKGAN
jgi:2-polyprenyl-3-methyl-5-hydroxy-6-metoxy-1,4-benzoquinol methylase